MSDQIAFIKSFNKGQITIPKTLRDYFRLSEEFWLKISKTENAIVLEPITEKMCANLQSSLAKINDAWEINDYESNRQAISSRLNKHKI